MNLDGVCITDHETMAIRHLVREGEQENGLVVVIGQEYETPQGGLLFVPFEELAQGLEAGPLPRLVRASGGVAVGAHPFRTERPLQEQLLARGLCSLLEGSKGRNTALESMKVQAWREKYAFREVNGSDAHSLEGLGRYPTRFLQRVDSRESLVTALKSGGFQTETGCPVRETAHVP